MRPKYIYLTLGIIITSFLAFAAFQTDDSGETQKTNKDLIKFNHEFHSQVAECADCHTSVPESSSLTDNLLPKMDDCGMCHDIESDDNCTLCHYEDVYEPLIQKKSEIKFDHSFHLSEQDQECEKCHQGITTVEYAFESEHFLPEMNDCYSCHNNVSVARNDCETCHISTADLLPDNHKVSDFLKNHKFAAESSDENCAMCHDNSFCESCHVSTNMIDEKNTASDFYLPYSPTKLLDNAKEMQIVRVHDLNYVYSHGIDAKGKIAECQTCHQTETFCAECHASMSNDYAVEGVEPSSHNNPAFVTIGVGSGGGEHAALARRDIENCAACHDTQGADPTCILCHVDNDGIKGTNPKTHISSFMTDNNGDWHSDAGAVCYNCHTDANARPDGIPGVGFCGYCHGSNVD